MTKEHLGDGCYAAIENGMIKLTTSNGIEDTNTIYLEPETYETLVRYVARAARDGASDSSGGEVKP